MIIVVKLAMVQLLKIVFLALHYYFSKNQPKNVLKVVILLANLAKITYVIVVIKIVNHVVKPQILIARPVIVVNFFLMEAVLQIVILH